MDNEIIKALAEVVATSVAEVMKPVISTLQEVRDRLPEIPQLSEEEKEQKEIEKNLSSIWDRASAMHNAKQ